MKSETPKRPQRFYASPSPWCLFVDAEFIRIAANTRTFVISVSITGVLLICIWVPALYFGGLGLALNVLASLGMFIFFVLFVGAIACQMIGPDWLIIDRKNRVVKFPRSDLVVPAEKIIAFEAIIDISFGGEEVSDLRAIVGTAEGPEQIVDIVGAPGDGAVSIGKALATESGLPYRFGGERASDKE